MTLAELEYTKVCEAVISTWSVPKHAQEQDLNDLTLLAPWLCLPVKYDRACSDTQRD